MQPKVRQSTGPPRFIRKFVSIVLFLLVSAIIVSLLILAFHWPFTREKSIDRMEHFAESALRVGKFRQTFFPNPGYVAEDLVFSREFQGRSVTMASARKFTVQASWWTMLLLRHQLKQVQFSGLKVYAPLQIPEPTRLHPEEQLATTITEAVGDGATLEVEPRPKGGPPLLFTFPRLLVRNVGGANVMSFRTVVHIPEPTGILNVEGSFGPVTSGKVLETPLSGTFSFSRADLGCFRSLSGLLASSGFFRGDISRIAVRGTATVPNFALSSSHHEVALWGNFDTVVDGQNGDVSITSVRAGYLHTAVEAHGSVSTEAGQQGKTVSLDLTSKQGRVEDLLKLFLKSDPSPMNGNISFQTHVQLPSGKDAFLKRVRLRGSFQIDRGRFSNPQTQGKLDQLSAHARGNKRQEKHPTKAPPVVSDFSTAVALWDGKAHFSNTSLVVPAASVRGAGTFNLLNQSIDWSGTLAMQASLSQATTGVKSLLLKPLDPLFKRRHSDAVLPSKMSGTYAHPSFELSLKGGK